MSESHFGIHKRTEEFIREYHYPYFNRAFVIEQWRRVVLDDFWLYNSLPKGEKPFAVIINIFHTLMKSALKDSLKVQMLQTMLEFIGKLAKEGYYSSMLSGEQRSFT